MSTFCFCINLRLEKTFLKTQTRLVRHYKYNISATTYYNLWIAWTLITHNPNKFYLNVKINIIAKSFEKNGLFVPNHILEKQFFCPYGNNHGEMFRIFSENCYWSQKSMPKRYSCLVSKQKPAIFWCKLSRGASILK